MALIPLPYKPNLSFDSQPISHSAKLGITKLPQICLPSSSSSNILSISKPVTTDTPPSQQLRLNPDEMLARVQHLQEEMEEALNLKDEHIQFLKTEIHNLPPLILSQLQMQLESP